jgi:hypothetical protein
VAAAARLSTAGGPDDGHELVAIYTTKVGGMGGWLRRRPVSGNPGHRLGRAWPACSLAGAQLLRGLGRGPGKPEGAAGFDALSAAGDLHVPDLRILSWRQDMLRWVQTSLG